MVFIWGPLRTAAPIGVAAVRIFGQSRGLCEAGNGDGLGHYFASTG